MRPWHANDLWLHLRHTLLHMSFTLCKRSWQAICDAFAKSEAECMERACLFFLQSTKFRHGPGSINSNPYDCFFRFPPKGSMTIQVHKPKPKGALNVVDICAYAISRYSTDVCRLNSRAVISDGVSLASQVKHRRINLPKTSLPIQQVCSDSFATPPCSQHSHRVRRPD